MLRGHLFPKINRKRRYTFPITVGAKIGRNSIVDDLAKIQNFVHHSPLLVKKPKSPEELAIKELQKDIQKFSEKMSEMHEQQNKMYSDMLKLSALILKLHAQGEINQDTFNKLDDFLKPYYDDENLLEDY